MVTNIKRWLKKHKTVRKILTRVFVASLFGIGLWFISGDETLLFGGFLFGLLFKPYCEHKLIVLTKDDKELSSFTEEEIKEYAKDAALMAWIEEHYYLIPKDEEGDVSSYVKNK